MSTDEVEKRAEAARKLSVKLSDCLPANGEMSTGDIGVTLMGMAVNFMIGSAAETDMDLRKAIEWVMNSAGSAIQIAAEVRGVNLGFAGVEIMDRGKNGSSDMH
jgi:hypothetical protein